MDKLEPYKNVKLKEHIHTQIKKISGETGVNVGKLVEMGAMHIVDEYKNGEFDKLIGHNDKRIRRDGSLTRTT